MNLLLFNLRVDRHDTALGFTTDWINEIAKYFDHVTVITMYRGEVAVAQNVDVISAGLENGWSKPRRVVTFYRGLFEALRTQRYDCCFAHMMPLFLLLAGPILKLKGIPATLWYAHNYKSPLLPLATAFAVKALASTRTAFPLETPKLRVIGQGVDTDRFRPAAMRTPNGTLRLLTIGRVSQVKNIDLMLRAIARLHEALPNLSFSFHIVGEPLTANDRQYLAGCERLVLSLGIDEIVEWLPSIPFPEIHEAYHRGDIFLSANDNGLDKAILEAMASGLPVVAMHPAVAEPLGPYFAPAEQAFGDALISLCSLGQTGRSKLGANLRTYVDLEHGLTRLGRRIADELKETAA